MSQDQAERERVLILNSRYKLLTNSHKQLPLLQVEVQRLRKEKAELLLKLKKIEGSAQEEKDSTVSAVAQPKSASKDKSDDKTSAADLEGGGEEEEDDKAIRSPRHRREGIYSKIWIRNLGKARKLVRSLEACGVEVAPPFLLSGKEKFVACDVIAWAFQKTSRPPSNAQEFVDLLKDLDLLGFLENDQSVDYFDWWRCL